MKSTMMCHRQFSIFAGWLCLGLPPGSNGQEPPPAGGKKSTSAEQSSGDYGREAATHWLKKAKQSKRKVDPFGLPMDPEVPLPKPEVPVEKEPADPGVTLRDGLSTLRITGVNAKRGEILAMGRRLKLGDVVRVKVGDRQFEFKLREITSREITLEDLKTGEKGKVVMGILPGL